MFCNLKLNLGLLLIVITVVKCFRCKTGVAYLSPAGAVLTNIKECEDVCSSTNITFKLSQSIFEVQFELLRGECGTLLQCQSECNNKEKIVKDAIGESKGPSFQIVTGSCHSTCCNSTATCKTGAAASLRHHLSVISAMTMVAILLTKTFS